MPQIRRRSLQREPVEGPSIDARDTRVVPRNPRPLHLVSPATVAGEQHGFGDSCHLRPRTGGQYDHDDGSPTILEQHDVDSGRSLVNDCGHLSVGNDDVHFCVFQFDIHDIHLAAHDVGHIVAYEHIVDVAHH